MALPENMVTNILKDYQGKFFTVKFLTKNDEVRTYNGRMGVTKGLKGNERGQLVADALRKQGYNTIMTSKGYKCFQCSRVLALKAGGHHVFTMGEEIV